MGTGTVGRPKADAGRDLRRDLLATSRALLDEGGHTDEAGQALIEQLLVQIDGGTAHSRLLPTTLVARASSQRAARRAGRPPSR